MTTTVIDTSTTTLAYRELIDEQLWGRLTRRIVKDEEVSLELAERIMNEALAFLKLHAVTGESYSPSPLVDIGWHTFILYTRPYMAFCQKMAGHYIHHNPFDEDGVDYGSDNIARTVAALEQYGIAIDESLWANTGHDCGSDSDSDDSDDDSSDINKMCGGDGC